MNMRRKKCGIVQAVCEIHHCARDPLVICKVLTSKPAVRVFHAAILHFDVEMFSDCLLMLSMLLKVAVLGLSSSSYLNKLDRLLAERETSEMIFRTQ
jgi:hypothetical protein